VVLAALIPQVAAAQATRPQDASCRPEPFDSGRVAAVKDARTLALADGREVRLAGLEVPAAETGPGQAAIAALGAHSLGKAVTLARAGPVTDRYGRVLAQVFVDGAGGRALQDRLLEGGHARLSDRAALQACQRDSLAFERHARAAKLGLWADPEYDLRRADRAAEIVTQRGRFAIVEGTVLSVRESGGTIYVNFGRRWSEDFTATIPKRVERSFAAAGLEPKQLERRRVRVRGWVEERGGPWIEVIRPEQIEIAERKP
jgi:endonuclease YncB( thermonuclease family)